MNNHVEMRVTIPRELYERMQKHLAKQGIKKPAFVRQAIQRALRFTPSDPPEFDPERPL